MIRLLLLSFLILFSGHAHERKMVFVIPSYNNTEWYAINLLTAMNQSYENYRILYINDGSTDGTGDKVAAFAEWTWPGALRSISFDNESENIPELTAKFKEEVNRERPFFTLVNNRFRRGAMQNWYLAVQSCDDDEIIVSLDGDDWLSDDGVLQRLNQTYASGEVWMTHGNLIEYPTRLVAWCEPVPGHLIAAKAVRKFKCPSHMRTFYAWLFKKIRLEDFMYDGKFLQMTCDMAIMYPILEMCAERHSFVHQVNYVYNMCNPINDGRVNSDLLNQMDRYIRNKPPYQRLEKGK